MLLLLICAFAIGYATSSYFNRLEYDRWAIANELQKPCTAQYNHCTAQYNHCKYKLDECERWNDHDPGDVYWKGCTWG